MSEKWKLPPPSETLRAIEEWGMLNLNFAAKEQVQSDFDRLFSSILKVFIGESTTSGYSTFYRIRTFDYLIGHENQLWAPPPDKTKKGRCNFEQEPVLYLSADGANCFDELNVQPDQQVYLIRYKKKPGELRLRTTYGTDWESIGLGNEVFDTETDGLSYKILREFLRSEFMKPTCRKCDGSNFIYNVTASIAAYLKSQPNVAGFVYPSAVNVFSKNVALFPEYEKQKLELQEVRIVKLVSNTAGEVAYESLFNGIIDDKKQVNWTPCSGRGSFRRMTAKDIRE